MNTRARLSLTLAALAFASLACKTVMGTGQGGSSYTEPDYKPTPTATPVPVSQRLSGEDVPLIEVGPPGDSPRDRGRPRLSGEAFTLDTEHFRIHYTLDGEDGVPELDDNDNLQPDYVEEVARAFEFSWSAEIDYFGWAAPPPDDGQGGDDRYDVYLQNIMDDDYAGYTDADEENAIIGDNPNTPNLHETDSTRSHIVVDNDYEEYEDFASPSISLIEYMRSTAAHEFNHAIQFGYDGLETHDWLWEATATWMEEEVFDSINEVVDTLTSVFKSPDSCQLTEGGEDRVEDEGHWYGMWILMRYISEHYGHHAILRLWELAAIEDGYDAWDAMLDEMGLTMSELFRDYSIAMLTRDFEEGLKYPTVRLEGRAQLDDEFEPADGVEQLGADYVEIMARETYTVTLNSDDLSGVLVGVTDEQTYVFPLFDDSATVDGQGLEHSYLIVMNMNQARGASNCRAVDYTVTVESGGRPQQPTWQLPAPDFAAPKVEPLQDPDE